MKRKAPNMTYPWIIAHRGDHRNQIENTLEAIQEAYDQGAQLIECDIQITQDGIPFLFHDDNLNRFHHNKQDLYRLDWEQISMFELVETKAEKELKRRIPSLQSYIQQFSHQPAYLELKIPNSRWNHPNYVQDLCEKSLVQLSQHDLHSDTFLASFHPDVGDILRALNSKFKYARIFEYPTEFNKYFSDLTQFESIIQAEHLDYISLSWKNIVKPRLKDFEKLDTSKIMLWDIKGEDFLRFKNIEIEKGSFKALISDTFYL